MRSLKTAPALMQEKTLTMRNKALIKEIFQSIQGEGLYTGVNQLFIRFSRCNLNCSYCDTDFKTNLKEYTPQELAEITAEYKNIHSVSLTGGEPLMETDFLKEFLPLCTHKIYLETNGVLYENLKQLLNFIDIISMDIKLPSCTKNRDLFYEHEEFIKAAEGKELFAKIVFGSGILESEIKKCAELGRKYSIPLVLQPEMKGNKPEPDFEFIRKIFYNFIELYPDVRLIGQNHKFLNLR